SATRRPAVAAGETWTSITAAMPGIPPSAVLVVVVPLKLRLTRQPIFCWRVLALAVGIVLQHEAADMHAAPCCKRADDFPAAVRAIVGIDDLANTCAEPVGRNLQSP